jgi:putative salt-induced outer membrane protein YdiY
MMALAIRRAGVLLALAGLPGAAHGQEPEPPLKVWTTSAGVGLALTSGNSDTSTFNANYSVAYDPHQRNVIKSDGLFIRGMTEGELTTERLALNVRDEYRIDGFFVFGQNQYLRDAFKEIDYLIAPTIGLGYKVADAERTALSVGGGAGAVWEKNRGALVRSSGAITLDEQFRHAISSTATVTHAFSGLWKTDDFADALYQVGAGIAVSVSTRTQIKLEWLDTFKNKPPGEAVRKNDISVLVALIYKN